MNDMWFVSSFQRRVLFPSGLYSSPIIIHLPNTPQPFTALSFLPLTQIEGRAGSLRDIAGCVADSFFAPDVLKKQIAAHTKETVKG
jgi:hypothetical protein